MTVSIDQTAGYVVALVLWVGACPLWPIPAFFASLWVMLDAGLVFAALPLSLAAAMMAWC